MSVHLQPTCPFHSKHAINLCWLKKYDRIAELNIKYNFST